MTVIPGFTFRDAVTSRGLIASGEGSAEWWNPLMPADMKASNGFLLVLNGVNLNRRLADVTGYSGATATAVELLQMRAPREPVAPAVGMMGAGRVFGRDFIWQYRWEDSRTGEHSGLSTRPETRTNLGTEQPVGGSDYLGQNAYFIFLTADAPAHADTLRLFRSASRKPDVVYSVSAVSIVGLSFVSITDDVTDDELLVGRIAVSSDPSAGQDLPSGPTWAQGVMPPMCRAWQDPTGRTVYFGIRRCGRYWRQAPTSSVTQGSDLVSINSVANTRRLVEPSRIGQRVRFYVTADLNDPIEDPTVYRFVKAESAFTFRVTPEIAVSADIAAGATVNVFFAIEDDRDERVSYMSEPGKPWLIDPRKGIAVGDDYDDGPRAWFALGDVYQITRRRIYRALDYVSLDPSKSVRFTQVAAEGMVGFNAGCITPFGFVYLNEKLGPRLFDGATVRPLDAGATPLSDFMAASQFANFEPSMLEECVVAYDATNHAVLVSYAPLGGSALTEELYFDVGTGTWRGPHRSRTCAAGSLRTPTTEDQFVTGDDFGNLMVRETQVLDVTPAPSTGATHVGTILSVQNPRVFTNTGTDDLTLDGDERLRGSPIWLYSGSAYYFARVADILSSSQLELDGPPTGEDGVIGTLAAGWTYGIGSIRWEAKTAYIDGGEPMRMKDASRLGVRFERGAAAATFEAGCSADGDESFLGERVSTATPAAPTADVNGTVFGEFTFQREGRAFQIRLRGTARLGTPKVTGAILDVVPHGGTAT